KRGGLNYLLTLLPAMFMTAVCVTFICVDKIGFRMPEGIAPWLGLGTFVVSGIVFWLLKKRSR
ncbi:MAG: carbon starvation protein A, partial [Bacteroidales bacterium]|nr:carbon starvation protein A [Bacteroidales bacterium]